MSNITRLALARQLALDPSTRRRRRRAIRHPPTPRNQAPARPAAAAGSTSPAFRPPVWANSAGVVAVEADGLGADGVGDGAGALQTKVIGAASSRREASG